MLLSLPMAKIIITTRLTLISQENAFNFLCPSFLMVLLGSNYFEFKETTHTFITIPDWSGASNSVTGAGLSQPVWQF